MFGTSHSPMATRERLLCSILSFHFWFQVAQSDYTRKDATALGVIRTLSRIDRIFINLPMAEARDFHCYSHVFENLGKKTVPSDHCSTPRHSETNKSRAPEQTYSQLDVQSIPFFVPYCSNVMTATHSLLTHFVHLLILKFSYTKPRR